MSRGAFISNLFAKNYAKQPIADPESYEKKLELTRKYLTPDSEVLEIGCGTGSTALLHAPYVKHIEGTDYSSKMIEIANEKLKNEAINNASFRLDDIDNLAKQTTKYDALLALNVLHLLEEPEAAIKNIHTLLKPGGYFISSTVCIDLSTLPKRWLFLFKIFGFLGLFPRIKGLKEQPFLEMIKDAGFSVEEQWNPENKWTVVFLVAKKI